MSAIAPYYASLLPQLFSVECWGGATFDVAMRFLREDPWRRLALLREQMPNLLLQMLLRSANAVGYANYPDNVVRFFVARAAAGGVDVFRIFDSLNWVENMRVAIDAVLESGKLCEAAICYTGNLSNPHEKKYTLDYYLKIARELKAAGTHVLAIKDMAGLCRPRAAYSPGQGAEGGDRPAGALPHARHQRHRRRPRAGGGGRRRRCRRRGDRCHERAHLAAEPRLDHRGAALRRARCRHRCRQPARDLRLLGAGAPPVLRLRERHARRRLGGLRARHARRAVHQPARAGALAGDRGCALAGGRRRLRRRQRHVRRHRQGDPDLQGGRRSCDPHGQLRHEPREGARPGHRGRLPGVGGAAVPRRPRPALRRLPARAAGEGAQGRSRRAPSAPARACRRRTSPPSARASSSTCCAR